MSCRLPPRSVRAERARAILARLGLAGALMACSGSPPNPETALEKARQFCAVLDTLAPPAPPADAGAP